MASFSIVLCTKRSARESVQSSHFRGRHCQGRRSLPNKQFIFKVKMLFRLPYLVPLIIFLSSGSLGQNLQDLPSCAQSPAFSAIGSTGCPSSDFACFCKSDSFINAALAGAEAQCPPSDLQKVLAFAQKLCSGVGVSLSVSAAGESTTAPTATTETRVPTPMSSPLNTSTQVMQSESSSSSANSAATITTGQASSTATNNVGGTATSSAVDLGARFNLQGMMWSAVVLVWCLTGVGS